MARYKITIEYDGHGFAGWQRQAHAPSIQAVIEDALAILNGETRIPLQGAGRTDAGVHAMGQVAHFDLERDITPFKLKAALNGLVKPHPISIIEAEEIGEDFHARFSALKRHYLYRLFMPKRNPALEKGRVWALGFDLNLEAMTEAAGYLVGQHDFTTFRNVACQAKSPIKTIDRIEIMARGEEIHIEVEARSFLHSQVRSFVGSLVEVGRKAWQPSDMKKALLARDRSACGPVAPPEGLYLTKVDYPG